MSNLAVVNGSLVYKGVSALVNVDAVQAATIAEKVLAENGNLLGLTESERKIYYLAMCDRYNVDPWSSPFDYLESKKNGVIERVSLYPNIRFANVKAQQNNIHVEILNRKIDITGKENGKYGSYEIGWAEVEVKVSDGRRSLTDIGMVEIGFALKRGDALKKAITQARRRAVLAFCGFSDGGEATISADSYDMPMDALPIPGSIAIVPDCTTEANVERLLSIQVLTGMPYDQLGNIAAKQKINLDAMDSSELDNLRDAIFAAWGHQQGGFNAPSHAWNAYKKFRSTVPDGDDQEIWQAWVAEVEKRAASPVPSVE